MYAALSGKLDNRRWLSFRKSVDTIATVAPYFQTLVVAVLVLVEQQMIYIEIDAVTHATSCRTLRR